MIPNKIETKGTNKKINIKTISEYSIKRIMIYLIEKIMNSEC